MKRIVIVVAAATLGLAALDAAAKGNAQAGQGKATVCAACHSADGTKPVAPDQPILAGQYEDYLAKALSDYKSGKRNNPIMKGFAAQLSKQDIDDLAAWFSSQPPKLETIR